MARPTTPKVRERLASAVETEPFLAVLPYYGIKCKVVRNYVYVQCPFHTTPTTEKCIHGIIYRMYDHNKYSCNTCGWSGNVEAFVMCYEKLHSTEEARNRIAEILQAAASGGKGAGS